MSIELTSEELEQMISAEAEDTPRMKCLKKAQQNHLACTALAGDDPTKKSACNKKLAEEVASCPPPQ